MKNIKGENWHLFSPPSGLDPQKGLAFLSCHRGSRSPAHGQHIPLEIQAIVDSLLLTAGLSFLDVDCQISTLESNADFPAEMNSLHRAMENAADYNALRQKLTADMADYSQR